MKVTLKQLVESIQGPNGQTGPLPQLMQDPFLPIATTFRLKRLLKAINAEIEEYEAVRVPLCAKYGKLNTATNRWDFLDAEGHLDTKKQDGFNKEHNKLLATVIDLPGDTLGIDDFGPRKMDAPPLPFSAANLLALDFLIKDDDWPQDIAQSDEAQAVGDILDAKKASA